MRDTTSHLPGDMRQAIAAYDAAVATGEITFTGEFADAYPREDKTDAELARFVADHVPGWE